MREAIERECSHSGPEGVVRVETAIPRTDALTWLRAQSGISGRVYWASRGGEEEVAGVGVADLVSIGEADGADSLVRRLDRRLNGGAGAARYFGGMRFDRQGASDASWRDFGALRFVLPRFELSNTGSSSVLACQWLRSEATARSILEEANALRFRPGEDGMDTTTTGPRHLPDRSAWNAAVSRVLGLVSEGSVDKLVLARKSTYRFSVEPDPLACLDALRPGATHCYLFCFIPSPGRAFLGVSPERLYRREGGRIRCEAIAGTRMRSRAVSRDRQLERDLIDSEKERREHDYVVRGIRESVGRLCRSLRDGAGVSVVKLWQCQHLMQTFQGVLQSGVGDADLLNALHPTPAVGGYPARRALRAIAEMETFDRGWYAGPVGWVGRDAAEFAVAIRSGLFEGSRLSVFAGAGIVAGSEAGIEWKELDQKTSHFLHALNLPW